MAKAAASQPTANETRKSSGRPTASGAERMQVVTSDSDADVGNLRFKAVMRAAREAGLLSEKGGRIGGRVSLALVRQAKRQTGIQADTQLIEFALATVALDGDFARAFKESRGQVDPELKLGF